MGQDDLGLIMKGVLPDLNFPVYQAEEHTHKYIIGKTLTSYVMEPEDLTDLKVDKKWNKAQIQSKSNT